MYLNNVYTHQTKVLAIVVLMLLQVACASRPAPVEDARLGIPVDSPDFSSSRTDSSKPSADRSRSGSVQGRPLQPSETVEAEVISPVSYTHLTLPTTPYV